jgi:hypothetical protein
LAERRIPPRLQAAAKPRQGHDNIFVREKDESGDCDGRKRGKKELVGLGYRFL